MSESDEEVGFEPIKEMDDVELRSMVLGYVSAADHMQLVELLSTCRELFFEQMKPEFNRELEL